MSRETAVDQFHFELISENAGKISAIDLNLSGVESCGGTEAITNTREVITGAMEEYAASDNDIPWMAPDEVVRRPNRRSL